MKRYLKIFFKISITLFLITCLCIQITSSRSHADAGYHSSYSGGSSSSSSSSHSSSSSSSSGSSGSSGGIHSIGSDLMSVFIWIVLCIIISCIANKAKSSSRSTKLITKLQSNNLVINKIKEILPDFDENKFLQDGYKIFLDVENAWMNFELEKVRNSITDEMFNMYESQLSSMEIKGEQNIMSDFIMRDCAIDSYNKQNDNIEITAKYIIEFYDYIIEKSTGKVLRGDKYRKLRMYYDFTFIMSDKKENIDKCPNCGAPLKINSAGVCEYCGSKVVGDSTNWVMSKKVCTRQENL